MFNHHPDGLDGAPWVEELRLGQILSLLPTHRGLLGSGTREVHL